MTDINKLTAKLKAAAQEATAGQWYVDSDFDVCSDCYGFVGEVHGDNLVFNAQFIALANPANILALTEALEKAQRANAAQDDHINQQQDRIEQLEKGNQYAAKRIAELEARTLTVKLPSLNAEMFNDDVMFGYQKAQKEAVEFCAAAGIKLQNEGK